MRNHNSCKKGVLNHGHVSVVEDGHSSNCRHVDDALMADAHVEMGYVLDFQVQQRSSDDARQRRSDAR